VRRLADAEALPAVSHLLWHERHGVERRLLLQGGEHLGKRAHLDPVAREKFIALARDEGLQALARKFPGHLASVRLAGFGKVKQVCRVCRRHRGRVGARQRQTIVL
jgi:hypothetical protein